MLYYEIALYWMFVGLGIVLQLSDNVSWNISFTTLNLETKQVKMEINSDKSNSEILKSI